MTPIQLNKDLIKKFTISGPRYTSYPTAPQWEAFTPTDYEKVLNAYGQTNDALSLYIHIPFCHTMCYYCGCNVEIRRKNGSVGDSYVGYLAKEMALVTNAIQKKPNVKQLHLGGGTPNFLTADQLSTLMDHIKSHFNILPESEIAIEIDPRTVQTNQLETLKTLGFNRISMGIQDFDPKVQKAINRIQPLESIQSLMKDLRSLHFDNINMDLIYGLPHQSPSSFKTTIEEVISLKPERIALYSYAHVPWLKSHQCLIKEDDLPTADQKLEIFLQARKQFTSSRYKAIAMDHFACETDELATAFESGTLFRNFMGYTTKPANHFIGLGATSIGYVAGAFVQNVHQVSDYQKALDQGKLATQKGLTLSKDDLIRQSVIQDLMCKFTIKKATLDNRFGILFDQYFLDAKTHLDTCEKEGLIQQSESDIRLTELGKLFVRNICIGFDKYFRKSQSKQQYSKTI
ncbi:MAG: oxygen-independent coproporphyrinogen-3 oxidase [Candidatus Marinamargulisbacteria bacterium]|jgi:oxygen-independent coproporphyrinogen-3 oxidase